MLSYEVTGNGAGRLVFLHGFGGSRGLWCQQLSAFAEVATCLSVDLPGHGESGLDALSLSGMAGEVAAVLRQEAVEKAVCVASSFGGLVALEAWQRSPGVWSSITLVGSLPRFTVTAGFPAGLDAAKIRKLAGQFEGDLGSALEVFCRSLFTAKERQGEQYRKVRELRRRLPLPQRKALLGMLDILERADLRELFKDIDVPIQVINGDGDYICPLAAVEVLRGMRPSLRVDVIRDGGHLPFLSFPHEFNRVLSDFIKL